MKFIYVLLMCVSLLVFSACSGSSQSTDADTYDIWTVGDTVTIHSYYGSYEFTLDEVSLRDDLEKGDSQYFIVDYTVKNLTDTIIPREDITSMVLRKDSPGTSSNYDSHDQYREKFSELISYFSPEGLGPHETLSAQGVLSVGSVPSSYYELEFGHPISSSRVSFFVDNKGGSVTKASKFERSSIGSFTEFLSFDALELTESGHMTSRYYGEMEASIGTPEFNEELEQLVIPVTLTNNGKQTYETESSFFDLTQALFHIVFGGVEDDQNYVTSGMVEDISITLSPGETVTFPVIFRAEPAYHYTLVFGNRSFPDEFSYWPFTVEDIN
ncbi:DUF4352 domain-containing protein [Bacillus alkalicellulosilyticus]|uniref:DUF4352 domain-containing protein n=1 Tax=Alkalihalobacterium alkalicellulosilyticum TaxID=1912214 RepID=UPI0009983727|nr:DUF4352 domain-containing protein [Bacillus alkalicellulosilyticus]